jgi:hypothetical protein
MGFIKLFHMRACMFKAHRIILCSHFTSYSKWGLCYFRLRKFWASLWPNASVMSGLEVVGHGLVEVLIPELSWGKPWKISLRMNGTRSRYEPGTWRVRVCALSPHCTARFRVLKFIIFHIISTVDKIFQVPECSWNSTTTDGCVTHVFRICGLHDDGCSYCRMGCVIADHRDTVFFRNVGVYLQD